MIPEEPSFRQIRQCKRQFGYLVGFDGWEVHHFVDSNGFRVYSMLGTSNFQSDLLTLNLTFPTRDLETINEFRQSAFHCLQNWCLYLKIPMPLEFVSYEGGGIGYLYSPFLTIGEILTNDSSMINFDNDIPSSFKEVLRNIIYPLMTKFVKSALCPWVFNEATVVMETSNDTSQGRGWTFLLPWVIQQSKPQPEMCFDSVSSFLMNLTVVENLSQSTRLIDQLYFCMSRVDTIEKARRLKLCPILFTGIDDKWDLIQRTYYGLFKDEAFAAHVDNIQIDWEVFMYEMPAEFRAMHDARAKKSNPFPFVYKSSVSLIKLLRHFKHRGNQKRETLRILHAIYNRLKPEGVDYWEMKLKDVKKYLQCTGDEVKDQLRMGKYDDMDTLLSYVNSGNYVVEDVELHVRDKAIFEAIDSHCPNFLGQIFVGSFFEGVQDYIPDFDFPRDHNDDDAMSGELLHGQPAGGSNDIPTDRTLYVENLHFSMTEQQLQQIFEPFGHVEFLQLPLDPETGQCKGFGFVQFAQVEHAKAAQSALNGNFAIAGQVIKVLSVDEYMN